MQDPSGELTITGTAQREAWLRRVMPPAEQLDGGPVVPARAHPG